MKTQNAELLELYRTLPGYAPEEDKNLFNESRGQRIYIGWRPGDDYMSGRGWAENLEYENWQDFREQTGNVPNDLNIVADFYFNFSSDLIVCPYCDGQGVNQETKEISDSFYDFEGRGTRWCDRITQDEVDMLIEEGRLVRYPHTPSAEEVNKAQNEGGLLTSHDAINRWLLVKHRARKQGVFGYCEHCEGGEVRVGEDRIELHLWILHPRKGTGRGWTIKSVTEEDLPDVKTMLKEADKQNSQRFAWATEE